MQAFAIVLVGAMLLMLFVVVVDPYRIYQFVDNPGFNTVKPPPERFREELKLTAARANHANAFIAGNSRAEIGFDPEYARKVAPRLSFYNLALSGTAISTTRRELAYLRAHGQQPSVIVLGVDFLDFLIAPSARPELEVPSSVHPADRLQWRFETLFSLASVMDGIRTLRIQHMQDPESITALGFNPLMEYKRFAREQGYYTLFQQRAMENAKAYVNKPRSLTARGRAPGFEDFRAIMNSAAAGKSDLHVVIYPYHAQILAMFEQVGLWPLFEEWKRMLSNEISTANRHANGSKLQLWDFSGYSHFHCEHIPERNEKTETEWYWEAGHFKPQLGNVVLRQVLSSGQYGADDESFGYLVTPNTLEENRNRIARERKVCAASYPELFLQAQQLIASAAGIEGTERENARPGTPGSLFANTAGLSRKAN
ncbi:MAG TPA: hypothetical protein VJ654_09705 [Noviherbaspirillum sp.]|nr:hypothetical protein [Noviherbaspirillum sp.]